MTSYAEFLAAKHPAVTFAGPDVDRSDIHPMLHDWQAELVQWACRIGRAAIWADTGLGKTVMQLEWARPVWLDIRETNTLNARVARDAADERHICPLQLDFIERCVRLWSNTGETVLSPFAGIGSEVYVAVKLGRRGVGIELKPSYWQTACNNLRELEDELALPVLDFDAAVS